MIIYPSDHLTVRFEDVIEEFNRAPSEGDDGHVEDHAILSRVLFDVPQTTVLLGYAYKDDGQWHLYRGTNPEPDMGDFREVTFPEVRQYVDRVGVVTIADDPHDAADGETDWTEDSGALDDMHLTIFAAGAVGVAHAVGELIQRFTALEKADD